MTAGPEVAALLANSHLFRALGTDDLARVAHDLHERTYEQGQTIFYRGDPGHDVHLLVTGQVRLSVLGKEARELSFNLAEAGAIFGEIAALDGGPRTANAMAVTKARTASLSHTILKRLILAHPQVADAAIMLLCGRLRSTSEQLEEVALCPIDMRLARYLLHRLDLQQLDARSGPHIDLRMSQTELALLLGTSRPSVNAALASLEKQGAIKRSGMHLECNTAQLTRAAGLD